LIEVLPGLLVDFGIMLIKTLVSLPLLFAQSIHAALHEAAPRIFDDPDEAGDSDARFRARRRRENTGQTTFVMGRGKEFLVDVLANAFNPFESGGRLSYAQSGLRFTGQSSGLAVLHPGEFVVPRTGQAPQNVQRDLGSQSGGGGVNVHITGTLIEHSAVDELVRRIENRFLSFGGGSSPLFGGT